MSYLTNEIGGIRKSNEAKTIPSESYLLQFIRKFTSPKRDVSYLTKQLKKNQKYYRATFKKVERESILNDIAQINAEAIDDALAIYDEATAMRAEAETVLQQLPKSEQAIEPIIQKTLHEIMTSNDEIIKTAHTLSQIYCDYEATNLEFDLDRNNATLSQTRNQANRILATHEKISKWHLTLYTIKEKYKTHEHQVKSLTEKIFHKTKATRRALTKRKKIAEKRMKKTENSLTNALRDFDRARMKIESLSTEIEALKSQQNLEGWCKTDLSPAS
ncbi:MAG: hypothetical protein K1X66_08460 [Verrucomicrobiae bacterium]|nr:hypothetical protein [Verrucomicrobiae bacterium]